VFADENEQITNRLLESGTLQLEKQEIICGYGKQADSMYTARFVKIR
jgi:hypothetical protein